MQNQPVDLSAFNSFRTAANAQSVYVLKDIKQLPELSQQLTAANSSWIILGEGSNVLFVGDYAGTVVINRLKGISLAAESEPLVAAKETTKVAAGTTAETASVIVAAGENWHQFVLKMSQLGYHGLENLALIPGSVGAAPVQNIGAYGVEVAEFIESVTVFDVTTHTTKQLPAKACGFAYRDSLFKSNEWRLRYIIIAVTFTLQRQFSPVLTYQGLQSQPPLKTAQELIQRVIDIRQSKLPDPKILPNAGSFFKNPVVAAKQLKQLQIEYPKIPYFTLDDDTVKIPAAWLLQTCGYKGKKTTGGAGVYEHHALILVNHGGASGQDVWALASDMIAAVQKKFSITLTPEVRLIPSLSR